jgi:RNA polymerase sigma-70 factor (ECF subfamily)
MNEEKMTDEQALVKKILAGDKAAQKTFYEDHAKRLYPVCVHFLGNQDPDAEDIIQETFMIGFRKLKEFEFRSSLYTWLNHICVNLCYKRLEKRKRLLMKSETDLQLLDVSRARTLEDEKHDEAEKKERLEKLERLMGSLSENCRKVLDLRDRKGESYIQISLALKIPMGTVMSQLARCRKALKELFEGELNEVAI